MALYLRKNLQHRFVIPNNPDKLFVFNKTTIQCNDNIVPSKSGSNFGLPTPGTLITVLGSSVLDSTTISFKLFMKTFIKIAQNQVFLQAFIATREKTSNRHLSTRNSDLYHRNLYIEC